MDIHVGIIPYTGLVSAHDKLGKMEYELNKCSVEQHDYEKINLMFEDLLSRYTLRDKNRMGCLCIRLEPFYNNVMRKKFIEEGLRHNFKKVEIIDYESTLWLNAVMHSAYVAQNGDTVWILTDSEICVWRKRNNKAVFVEKYSKLSSMEDKLVKIKEEEKKPDVFLYNSKYSFFEDIFKDLLPDCQIYDYEINGTGAVFKALIMSNFFKVAYMDIEKVLDRYILISYAGKDIIIIKKGEQLPFKKIVEVKKIAAYKDIKVAEYSQINFILATVNSMEIPLCQNFIIDLKIDINGIYLVKFILPKIITINERNVTIYDCNNKRTAVFAAAIDYGADMPKVGISYQSSTVITEPLKHFLFKPKNSSIPMKSVYLENCEKLFFVIKVDGDERFISTERLSNLKRLEAKESMENTNQLTNLVIPAHFNEIQQKSYIKAAKKAGFQRLYPKNEQLALAYGYEIENKESLGDDCFYVLVHFSDPKVVISLIQTGNAKKTEIEKKSVIIDNLDLVQTEAQNNSAKAVQTKNKNMQSANRVKNYVDECIECVNQYTHQKDIELIVVTFNQDLSTAIKNRFQAIPVTFVKSPDILIAAGIVVM